MTRAVVIIGFLVAFAAGFAVGTGYKGSRPASGGGGSSGAGGPGATTQSSGRDRRGWMERELGLNEQQKDQMRQIWSDVWRGHREHEDQRRKLRRERDEAIANLIRPEDMRALDGIHNRYDDAVAALDNQMRSRFDEKVRQTMTILTPEQQEKYQKILKSRSERDGDRDGKDRDGRGGGSGGSNKDRENKGSDERAATSRPA